MMSYNYLQTLLKTKRNKRKQERVKSTVKIPLIEKLNLGQGDANESNHISNENRESNIENNVNKTQQPNENNGSLVQSVVKRTPKDFIFGKTLGEGSFSTVFLAKDVYNQREYAIKVCNKTQIIREKKTPYVKREKEALNILSGSSPYFVKLYCTFQDVKSLYFVLTYAKCGELLELIKKSGSLSVELSKFYTCELVLALEMLKTKGIIHRDLKPENILLDEQMHILITDFGSAKILNEETDTGQNEPQQNIRRRRNSFVGTANYVSPEVLTDSPVTNASDLWALACILYQMLTGKHCFSAGSEYLIFQKVSNLIYEFPDDFHPGARDLVTNLLVINSCDRLGANDERPYESIRTHKFFENVDWNNLGQPPVIIKSIDSTKDEDCFEEAGPGLDEHQIARLIGLRGGSLKSVVVEDIFDPYSGEQIKNKIETPKNIADVSQSDLVYRLSVQQRSNKYHEFVDGNLILKQGLIDKRKGLIPRRRMFLLTLGPRLIYVDPNTMVKKGEVPWNEELRVEAKSFKIFFVHTPNRTYNLEDPEGYALHWCKAIKDVHKFYFPQAATNQNTD